MASGAPDAIDEYVVFTLGAGMGDGLLDQLYHERGDAFQIFCCRGDYQRWKLRRPTGSWCSVKSMTSVHPGGGSVVNRRARVP